MISGCDSDFSQAVYKALGALSVRASDAFLLQSLDSLQKARQALQGSLLVLKSGGWAYIPLIETSVSVRNGTLYALVRPSSGGKGKTVVLLDLAETVGSIIPGVLSSHLDPATRTFSAGHYADRLRSRKHGTEVITRIIVGHKTNGKLELSKAANGGNGSTDSFGDLSDAIADLNRTPLHVISTDGPPPTLMAYTVDPADVDLETWVCTRTAEMYRQERLAEQADEQEIRTELAASPPPSRLTQITQVNAQRLALTFRSLGISVLTTCSRSWLAAVLAAVAGIPAWAPYAAEALVQFDDSLIEMISALVGWVETVLSDDNLALTSLAADVAGLADEPARAAAIARALRSASQATVASTPAQYRGPQVFVPDTPETRAPSSQPPGFLAGTELSVAGLHTQQLRAPATPAARTAHGAPPGGAAGGPPPAMPTAPVGGWLCSLIERFTPHPAPDSPLEWLRQMGGAPTADLLSKAAGRYSVSIVSADSDRGARVAIKTLRTLAATELVGAFGAEPSTLDATDELWLDDRPADWTDATARVQEVVDATFDRRNRPASATAGATAPGLGPPPPPGFPTYPPYAQQFAPTPTIDAAAIGEAVKSALGSASHRRAGELKPPLASAAQREARTLCASEVFEAITDPEFVEAERALGSLSQRGGDFESELRRTRAFSPQQSHGTGAFAVSCGARPDDTNGGVPSSINQLRQAASATLKDDCEEAKGGPNRREIDTALCKAIHAAADGVLTGTVEFPLFVKLFGGIRAAQSIEMLGSAGAGRPGSVDSKADIEKALRFWARLVARVHAHLFGLRPGPHGDFGVSEFIEEAEHMQPSRIMRGCAEAFDIMRRQFIEYRSHLDAPQPDPRGAILGAISSALKPLQHEQLTVIIASTAAAAEVSKKGGGASAQDRIQRLETELRDVKKLIPKRDLDAISAGATRPDP